MTRDKPIKKPKSIKTYRNPMFVAKEDAEMIKAGRAKSQADLASFLTISDFELWIFG